MKNRDALCTSLEKQIRNIAVDKKKITSYSSILNDKFDLDVEVSNDYLTMRRLIAYANDFELFMFASVLKSDVNKYFTPQEIKAYSKARYSIDKLKFPLKYKMIQIADNQWIGKITVKELIKLRDAQVINYNENAQRTMLRIISGGVEHYQIAVNKTAVKGIMENYQNNTYIPNTVTLNLPENADFTYDEETNELIIKKVDGFMFDILDGYHRYLAISMLYNLDKSFDYNMELRIVQFDDYKAKQFIWQEDQKTKMKRVDSEAMNQTAIPTKVIARLNTDPTFNLSGKISPNEGIINAPWLHLCINSLFCDKRMKRSDELQIIIDTTERLKKVINYITAKSKKYLKQWDKRRIVAVTYAAYKNIPLDQILKEIDEYYDILCENKNLLVQYKSNATYSRKDFDRLDALRAERS